MNEEDLPAEHIFGQKKEHPADNQPGQPHAQHHHDARPHGVNDPAQIVLVKEIEGKHVGQDNEALPGAESGKHHVQGRMFIR